MIIRWIYACIRIDHFPLQFSEDPIPNSWPGIEARVACLSFSTSLYEFVLPKMWGGVRIHDQVKCVAAAWFPASLVSLHLPFSLFSMFFSSLLLKGVLNSNNRKVQRLQDVWHDCQAECVGTRLEPSTCFVSSRVRKNFSCHVSRLSLIPSDSFFLPHFRSFYDHCNVWHSIGKKQYWYGQYRLSGWYIHVGVGNLGFRV